MKHHPDLPDAAEQAYADDRELLAGYDALQEIYQWNMISAVLISELILVNVALEPLSNSLFFIASASMWEIRPGTIMPFVLLLLIILPLLRWRRYRIEWQQRERLRSEALSLEAAKKARTQSQPAFEGLELPIQIESKQKRILTSWTISGLCILALLLIVSYIFVFVSDWEVPFWFVMAPGVLGLLVVPGLYVTVGREVRLRIAGHYLLPSLRVDEEAITARYGRDTLRICWDDMRYFGLVSSATFRRLPGEKGRQSPPEREAFEISDGKKRICWLKAEPFRFQRLLRGGEVALSEEDYAIFTQQLAALIIEKTGLPLYDLRLTGHRSR